MKPKQISHNPYFNRWFSAIEVTQKEDKSIKKVTILILIDGFLQFSSQYAEKMNKEGSQSLF